LKNVIHLIERVYKIEVCKIERVDKQQIPTMYQLVEQLGEQIEGKFYEAELQSELKGYRVIEKVISSRRKNGQIERYVKLNADETIKLETTVLLHLRNLRTFVRTLGLKHKVTTGRNTAHTGKNTASHLLSGRGIDI
jgi:hypothetical protein